MDVALMQTSISLMMSMDILQQQDSLHIEVYVYAYISCSECSVLLLLTHL